MKRLLAFLFILLAYTTYASENAPTIICLKGSCSSGKSTFIKSLALTWKNLEILVEDAFVHAAYRKAVEQRFPLEYVCITKAINEKCIYYSLRSDQILFKKTATKEECLMATKAINEIQEELNKTENLAWRLEVSQNISSDILNRIQSAFQNNKIVLLDAWYIKEEHLQKRFPEASILKVMLYCSLPVAYERLLKRNADTIVQESLEEKRFIGNLIGSFCKLYQISNHPLQEIQAVEKAKLDRVFDEMRQSLTNNAKPKKIFTLYEISREQLQKIQTDFMQPFEENDLEILYITPKEKQDLIIDNTNTDVQTAIHQLEEILDEKKTNLLQVLECGKTH
jgi:dephospho-CoA kinase